MAAPHLKRLISRIERRHRTRRVELQVHDRRLRLVVIDNPEALLDALDDHASEDSLPYWAELWPSAVALGSYLLETGLEGKRVLEIGCGMGLVGLCAALAGAQVTMTDFQPDALLLAQANALLNGCSGARFRLLDWRQPAPAASVDMLVASDVLYERRNIKPVLAFTDKVLRPGGMALIADPLRRTAESFVRVASAARYEWRTMVRQVEMNKCATDVRIWSFRKAQHQK